MILSPSGSVNAKKTGNYRITVRRDVHLHKRTWDNALRDSGLLPLDSSGPLRTLRHNATKHIY
jgi:hypothetical protein